MSLRKVIHERGNFIFIYLSNANALKEIYPIQTSVEQFLHCFLHLCNFYISFRSKYRIFHCIYQHSVSYRFFIKRVNSDEGASAKELSTSGQDGERDFMASRLFCSTFLCFEYICIQSFKRFIAHTCGNLDALVN